jgi:diacylglycerol O-acyltransferase
MADLLSMTERAAANGGSVASDEFANLFPEITAFTERLRFNVIYRGPQKFACTEIPLPEVKAVRHKSGTSINDVILTLVTATIRRYCELHGERVKGRLLRIMVPVNLRGDGKASDLGNRISLVPVTIPLDIRHPRKLLDAVHQRTEFLKRMHAAELVSLAGGLIGMFPTSVQGLAGPIISQLPITPFNMVCTNVPGPQFPLYLLGHKMLHCYPYVPIGGEMAVNCAILSYNGTVFFGFSGDVHAAPDLRKLENLLMESFTELRAAVGIRPPEQKKPRRKRRVVSKVSAPPRTVPIPIPTPKTLSPLEPQRVTQPVPTAEQDNAVTHVNVA